MKLDRIEQEILKAREKMAAFQSQLKELENQKEEAENLQVIQLVRSYKLTHAELMAFLHSKQPAPIAAPAAPKPFSPPINSTTKEDDHE